MATGSSSNSLSSPTSFVTANNSVIDKSTAASSPASDKVCPYRNARQLPPELRDHSQIFLEEQLFSSAINFLNSIVCSGASNEPPSTKPVPIPPPSHLALLNTLIVHPLHTTRADKPENLEVSSLALGLLRNVLAVVGPVNADFKTAFQFVSIPRGGRRLGHYGQSNDSDFSDGYASSDDEPLRGKLANEGSLWCSGHDFWSTVGWALNCGTVYPNRWRYWKVWLEFMLDVLEADWLERERRDEAAHKASGNEGEGPRASRAESMILMYMEEQTGIGRRINVKSIIKAIFADGSDLSMAAFREVFEKEPRGPRKQTKKRKREQVLDIENDKFGDYFDDESLSSGVSEPPTPQKPKDPRKGRSSYNAGLTESIDIRLRFFKLLSEVTYTMSKRAELDRLYEECSAALKVLPLQTFSLFVTQRPNHLIEETHITLTRELFRLLLPSSYKKPAKVDPEADAEGCLTASMLEHCYMCYPANTVAIEENAKLSLVVESAIQLLWANGRMTFTESFAASAEKGIKARETKARKRRTGRVKGDVGDAFAFEVLNLSAERIRILINALREAQEIE